MTVEAKLRITPQLDAAVAGLRGVARELGGVGKSAEQASAGATSALRGIDSNIQRVGMSAKQAANAMRMVGPQVTDIVTQLASGQSPLMILVQQGGQLKDMFGGIGPAARALGGYVLGLVNPFTLAVAAVGALAAAYHFGSEESAKFQRQLILSGNAAGILTSDAQDMATALAAVSGTKGAALEALGEMAQGGQVAADQLKRFTGLAQQLDRVVGKSVADTATEFQALGEAPVTASLKLTKTYNYLTGAVYQQIKALEDQGRHEDAARLAQETFFKAMDDRLPAMKASLGSLERGWLAVKDAIKGAVDAFLEIGRPDTIESLAKKLKGLQGLLAAQEAGGARVGGDPEQTKAQIEAVRQLMNEKQRRSELDAGSAAADAQRQEVLEATARWEKKVEESLTNQQRLKRATDAIKADGLKTGKSQQEIDKLIAAERLKLGDTVTRIAQEKQLYDKGFELLADATQREAKLLQERWSQGLIGLQEYLQQKGRLQDQDAGNDIERLRRQRVDAARVLAENRAVVALDANAKKAKEEAIREGQRRVDQLDADIVKKDRDRLDTARALTQEGKNLTRELQLQANALDAEIRQGNGTDTPDAIARRVRFDRAENRKQFVGRGGDAALFDQNTDVAVRQAQLQLVQRQLGQARTDLSQIEEQAHNQESAGQISTEEAEKRILAARREQLPLLQSIAAVLRGMAVSPEEQAQARAAELENQRLGDLRTEAEKTLTTTAKSGLGQMFNDIATGAKTAGDALRSMLAGFAQQMLNLITKRLGERLFESFGLGRVVDGAVGYVAKAAGFHSGGVVSAAGASFTRSLNLGPLALAMAPRYHSGGIAGLKPGERLSVLQDGEEVLTADDPRHVRNYRAGGMQTSIAVTVNGATGDASSQQNAGADLGRAVEGAIDTWAIKQSRPGGILFKG
jgi:hypothetical protein